MIKRSETHIGIFVFMINPSPVSLNIASRVRRRNRESLHHNEAWQRIRLEFGSRRRKSCAINGLAKLPGTSSTPAASATPSLGSLRVAPLPASHFARSRWDGRSSMREERARKARSISRARPRRASFRVRLLPPPPIKGKRPPTFAGAHDCLRSAGTPSASKGWEDRAECRGGPWS